MSQALSHRSYPEVMSDGSKRYENDQASGKANELGIVLHANLDFLFLNCNCSWLSRKDIKYHVASSASFPAQKSVSWLLPDKKILTQLTAALFIAQVCQKYNHRSRRNRSWYLGMMTIGNKETSQICLLGRVPLLDCNHWLADAVICAAGCHTLAWNARCYIKMRRKTFAKSAKRETKGPTNIARLTQNRRSWQPKKSYKHFSKKISTIPNWVQNIYVYNDCSSQDKRKAERSRVSTVSKQAQPLFELLENVTLQDLQQWSLTI